MQRSSSSRIGGSNGGNRKKLETEKEEGGGRMGTLLPRAAQEGLLEQMPEGSEGVSHAKIQNYGRVKPEAEPV